MKAIYTMLLLGALYSIGFSQNVGIGTNTPDAKLDISTTNEGILIPRVSLTSTSNASPLTTPTTSELVYNTAAINDVTPGYYYWNGSEWERLQINGDADDHDWYESGGTSPDDISDNIYTQGNVGIGTTDLSEELSIGGDVQIHQLSQSTGRDGNNLATSGAEIRAFEFYYNPLSTPFAKIAAINYNPSGTGWYTLSDRLDAGLSFYVSNGGVLNNALNIDNIGRTGIGTSTPSATLDVVGSFQFVDGNEVYGNVLVTDNDGNAAWSNNAASAIDVGNGLNYAATLDEIRLGGSLEVNTTINQGDFKMNFYDTPLAGFNVDGSTFSVDGLNNRVGIGSTAPTDLLHLGTTGGIFFTNSEIGNTSDAEGVLFFDENYYGTGEPGDGDFNGNGGGLAIKNEDGWGALISTANMQYAEMDLSSLHVGGTSDPGDNNLIVDGTIELNSNDGDKIYLTGSGANGSQINHSSGWQIDYQAGNGNSGTNGKHVFWTTEDDAYTPQIEIESDGDLDMGDGQIFMPNNLGILKDYSAYTYDADNTAEWVTVSSYSNWLPMESGHIMVIDILARVEIRGGSGDDDFALRVKIDGRNGCGDSYTTTSGSLEDYDQFRDDMMPVTYKTYLNPACNGEVRFALQVYGGDCDDEIIFDDIVGTAQVY